MQVSWMPAFAGMTGQWEKLLHAMEKQPAVYILANRYRGTVYAGVTSSLWSRIWDHKNGTTGGFSSRYGLNRLVWYEHRHTMEAAIRREKQIKAWKRDWKVRLVEAMNPDWRDLHDEIDPISTLADG
jgi:putative endonuclease